MSKWEIDYIQKQQLKQNLDKCQQERRKMANHVKKMKQFKPQYEEMFQERLSVCRFRAQKYKDKQSCDTYSMLQEMWNSLKFILE